MIDERFDAIVVGAGMAGNAAALTLAQRGLKVLQLERGEYSGSKNVQGAILYADMLEKLIPDFREDAPLERHLIEQRFWMVDDNSHCPFRRVRANVNERTGKALVHHRRHGDQHLAVEITSAAALGRCAARGLHNGKVSPSIRNCKRTAGQKVHCHNVSRPRV